MTRKICDYHGPVYMRTSRNDLPDVISEDQDFEIGEPYLIRDGSDVVVFANGIMVSRALRAAEQLENENISARVVNVSSLKPVDENKIKEFAAGVKGIITAEEHSLIGGLANLITYILRGSGTPVSAIGIEDKFGQSAHGYDELLEAYGLTAENIVRSAIGLINKPELLT
jgi:transketolase